MTSLAKLLFDAAFNVPRDLRSDAYKMGCLATLRFRVEGQRMDSPFDEGTAESDAWYAGTAEGHAIWRHYRETATPGAN